MLRHKKQKVVNLAVNDLFYMDDLQTRIFVQ